MNSCETLRQYVAAYADGELPDGLRERVRTHLEACDACRAECDELAKVAELYRADAPDEVPEAEWAAMSEVLEATMDETILAPAATRERAAAPRPAFNWFWPGVLAAAAALVLVVVLNWPAINGPRTVAPDPGNGTANVAETVGETDSFACMDCLETGPDYEAMVRLPMTNDDVLIIDVDYVE